MNEPKWTKGPWEALPQNGAGPMIVHIFDTGNQMRPTGYRLIAHMLERGNSLDQDRANAHLIAAAPDLYEALETVAQLLRDHHGDQSSEDGWQNEEIRDAWLAARAVLAKARGEAP